ncbi:sulfatase [Novipirellula caenicola]|uniref:Sulfatase N-terminal domain-containing protein n=1 Tax=Novipirellula caenicola TaxID=1536901 RepID=A0ABP9VQQ3_9BACT
MFVQRTSHFLMFGLVVSLMATQPAFAKEPPPNIIIFYVDDLGWQDVQLNDVDDPCPYETPNIVKLAKAGMNFTEGYSPAPSCSPSRAGIITGQHPAKIRLTHVDLGVIRKGSKTDRVVAPYLEKPLDRDLLTLADAMKANGYRTGHSGKWHVGLTAASYGFDTVNQDRGPHRSVPDRTKDFATSDDPKFPLSKEKYPPVSKKKPEGISYPYDEVTGSAIEFMAQSNDEPFFLNLCHWMVHWPVMTRNGELLEYYCDKMGQPFPPKRGAMTLPGQQNPYFASMVTSVDWSLGRIVDFLQKTDDPRSPDKKLIDTTYIFFTSDNGGAEKKGKEVISDNAPLKYGKTHAEEGGVRVPMVIAGPGIEPGSRFDGLVNQLDFFPTILELTDSEISPDDFAELSGLDISAVLSGASRQIVDANGKERDHLFWHYPHGGDSMKSAIRSGDFKLYKRYQTDDYELYRLYKDGKRNDYEEANDLAQNPEFASVVERLGKMLEAELVANDAELPYLNPNYADKKTPVADLGKATYESAAREARLSIKPNGPAVKEAYVIYCEDPEVTKTKTRRPPADIPETRPVLPGMKAPATISTDGSTVNATIPKEIAAWRFQIIDQNGYLQYSDVVMAN